MYSIFSLSFGERIPKTNYASASFWGQVFQICQPSRIIENKTVFPAAMSVLKEDRISAPLRDRVKQAPVESRAQYLKPAISLVSSKKEQHVITGKNMLIAPHIRTKGQAIILHPLLPSDFKLYFKDRQVAHVELDFNIITVDNRSSILIKRRISSGNLEVDLLVKRYIGHYLFIQQSRFNPNLWQTVKIDLAGQ